MIQRIQSIYMLLAVILCGLTYFFPLSLVVGEAGNAGNALTLTACTVSGEVAGESVSGTPFGIAVLLLAALPIHGCGAAASVRAMPPSRLTLSCLGPPISAYGSPAEACVTTKPLWLPPTACADFTP